MDNLKNRRRMAWIAMAYSMIWYIMVFWTHALLVPSWGAGVVSAYIGVPAALAGLQLWRYLKACEDKGEE